MEVNPVAFNKLVGNIGTNQNKSSDINFSDMLKNALDKVNDKQVQAEDSTQKLINGEAENIHDVMIATSEAQMSLELAVQVRNKIVEAYQEISRMQI